MLFSLNRHRPLFTVNPVLNEYLKNSEYKYMKNINSIFVELFLVIIASLSAAYFFFHLDKNFIYVNNYFPWDSIEYLKVLKNYESNISIYKVGSPFNERILFPFFVYKISLIFKLQYINACLFLCHESLPTS